MESDVPAHRRKDNDYALGQTRTDICTPGKLLFYLSAELAGPNYKPLTGISFIAVQTDGVG